MQKVLVIGSATRDTIIRSGSSSHKMGGVVVYGALTFRRIGVSTSVVTNLAPRDGGAFESLFRRESIDCHIGSSAHTTAFVAHVDGDDRAARLSEVAAPITSRQVAGALEGVDQVHLGPLHPRDLDEDVLDLLARPGLAVSLDLQGYVRHVEGGEVTLRMSPIARSALGVASIVKAERQELAEVLRATGAGVRDLMIGLGVAELVVTAGRDGGRVLCASGEDVEYAAATVVEGDPTGAGDVFFAAYLVSRRRDRLGVPAACRVAAATASRQVSGMHIAEPSLVLEDA